MTTSIQKRGKQKKNKKKRSPKPRDASHNASHSLTTVASQPPKDSPPQHTFTMYTTHQVKAHVDELPIPQEALILDTGATNHMINNIRYFETLEPLDQPINVVDATGNLKSITYHGNVAFFSDAAGVTIRMEGCLYTPDLISNLFSYSQSQEKGTYIVDSEAEGLKLLQGSTTIASAIRQNRLFVIKGHLIPNEHPQRAPPDTPR